MVLLPIHGWKIYNEQKINISESSLNVHNTNNSDLVNIQNTLIIKDYQHDVFIFNIFDKPIKSNFGVSNTLSSWLLRTLVFRCMIDVAPKRLNVIEEVAIMSRFKFSKSLNVRK